MKRILISLIVVLLTLPAYAQHTETIIARRRKVASATVNYGIATVGGSTTSSYQAAQLYGISFTTGSDTNGYAPNSVSFYVPASTNQSGFYTQFGVYTTGGTLVCNTGAVLTDSTVAGTWVMGALSGCSNLSATTSYMLVYQSNGGSGNPTSGQADYSGSGSYPFYYVVGGTYGTWVTSGVSFPSYDGYNGLSIYLTATPQ